MTGNRARLAVALVLALAGCATVGRGGHERLPSRVRPARASSRLPARAPLKLASTGAVVVPESGVEPLVRAFAQERYDVVERALNEKWALAQDDLALELLESSGDEALSRAVRTPAGRRLLAWLFIELTAGWVSEGEAKQAHRILAHHAQHLGVEAFVEAMLSPDTKVFPYRPSGATVLHSAALMAWLEEDGSVTVHLEAAAYRGSFPETRKLPVSPIHVAADEVVGVRRYDEGRRLEYGPALLLLRYSNETTRRTLLKMTEMAALGLAAGAGGTAVRASLLVWCDRAAMAVGTLSMLVDEHRGWILERFGADGETFLRYSDTLGSAAALYGVVRVVAAAPKLLLGLRDSWRKLKAAQANLRGAERESFAAVEKEMEALLRSFDDLSREGADVIPIERARKPVPAVAREPIRATGTDGPLVPVQRGSAGEPTVASAHRGGGHVEPLRSAPPGESGPTVQPRGVPLRLRLANAEEAEVVAVKFTETELAFTGPRYTANPKALLQHRPDLHQRPPGMDRERWLAYVAYWHRRYVALAKGVPGTKPPLTPEAYDELATFFARGLQHERIVTSALLADTARPPAERELLPAMKEPRVDMQVGVAKEGVDGTRYVDQLVVDMATVRSGKPHVEAFSCKSRTLDGLDANELEAIVRTDINEALTKYGRRVEIRRPDHPLFRRKVEVTKVHPVYEAELVDRKIRQTITELGAGSVEVHFR